MRLIAVATLIMPCIVRTYIVIYMVGSYDYYRDEVKLSTLSDLQDTLELRVKMNELGYPKDVFEDILYFGYTSLEESFSFGDSFIGDLSVLNIKGIITSLGRHYDNHINSETKRTEISERIEYLESILRDRGIIFENWRSKKDRIMSRKKNTSSSVNMRASFVNIKRASTCRTKHNK